MESRSFILSRPKGRTVMLRLPVDLARELAEKANKQGLSMSSYLRTLIFKALEGEKDASP